MKIKEENAQKCVEAGTLAFCSLIYYVIQGGTLLKTPIFKS